MNKLIIVVAFALVVATPTGAQTTVVRDWAGRLSQVGVMAEQFVGYFDMNQ